VVTIGIDAHKSSLAVSLVDELGRELAQREFGNEPRAHRALCAWVDKLAPGKRRFGVESTGWVGRGIACLLLERGETVVDVRGTLSERQRKRLRGAGKSDPRDALAIARVAAREEQLPPARPDSPARDLKLLCDYRLQLIGERTRTANRLHVDLVCLRPGYERRLPRLDSLPRLELAERLLAKEPGVQAQLALRRIESLHRLDAEIRQLEREIAQSVQASGSGLPRLVGISHLSAGRIIGEVGDVARIASKARFARMNGTAPIPASSGQLQRHRLDKGGNRRLNHALHMMALTQARMDPRARAYVERRRAEGKSYREAVRALKRHLSDVVYQQLRADAGLNGVCLDIGAHQGADPSHRFCTLYGCRAAASAAKRSSSATHRSRTGLPRTHGRSSARRAGSSGSPTPAVRRPRRSGSAARPSTGCFRSSRSSSCLGGRSWSRSTSSNGCSGNGGSRHKATGAGDSRTPAGASARARPTDLGRACGGQEPRFDRHRSERQRHADRTRRSALVALHGAGRPAPP
jgi:transposase